LPAPHTARPDTQFLNRARKLAAVPHLVSLAGTAYEPVIHARQRLGVPTTCGQAKGMWTNLRYAVTCVACKAEIERPLAALRGVNL
jgi:hypothetical protein